MMDLPDFMKPPNLPFPDAGLAKPIAPQSESSRSHFVANQTNNSSDEPRSNEDVENDELIELMAKATHQSLTRAERKKINQAIHRQKSLRDSEAARLLREQYRDTARKPLATAEGKRQRLQEFKEMLLSPTNGTKVIRKVLEIALDDGHPGQMNALKMCLDRQLPISAFDEVKGQQRTAIQINITGIESTVTLDEQSDVTDVEPNDE